MWNAKTRNALLQKIKLKLALVIMFVFIALIAFFYPDSDQKRQRLPFSELENLKLSNVNRIGYATVVLDVHNGTPFPLDGVTISGSIKSAEGALVYPIVRWKDYSSELKISPDETKKIFLTEMDSTVEFKKFVVREANIAMQ